MILQGEFEFITRKLLVTEVIYSHFKSLFLDRGPAIVPKRSVTCV